MEIIYDYQLHFEECVCCGDATNGDLCDPCENAAESTWNNEESEE